MIGEISRSLQDVRYRILASPSLSYIAFAELGLYFLRMAGKTGNRKLSTIAVANQEVQAYIASRRIGRRRLYRCEFCDKEFSAGSGLRRHLHYCEEVPLHLIALLADASQQQRKVITRPAATKVRATTRVTPVRSRPGSKPVVPSHRPTRLLTARKATSQSIAGFIPCPVCGVPVIKIARHMRRVHGSSAGGLKPVSVESKPTSSVFPRATVITARVIPRSVASQRLLTTSAAVGPVPYHGLRRQDLPSIRQVRNFAHRLEHAGVPNSKVNCLFRAIKLLQGSREQEALALAWEEGFDLRKIAFTRPEQVLARVEREVRVKRGGIQGSLSRLSRMGGGPTTMRFVPGGRIDSNRQRH